VVDILTAIRRRLKVAERDHVYSFYSDNGEEGMYCFNDRELEEWFNFSREEALKIMSSICGEIGMPGLRFPHRRYYW